MNEKGAPKRKIAECEKWHITDQFCDLNSISYSAALSDKRLFLKREKPGCSYFMAFSRLSVETVQGTFCFAAISAAMFTSLRIYCILRTV